MVTIVQLSAYATNLTSGIIFGGSHKSLQKAMQNDNQFGTNPDCYIKDYMPLGERYILFSIPR